MAAPGTQPLTATGSAPKTPNSSTALTEAVSLPLQITPLESIETECDPNTPHKDPPLKTKPGKLVSKRKLFLQNGQSLQINKAKRNTTPKTSNVQNPASRPVEAGPKVNYPLTERQQLQYLLEVTAKEAKQDSGTSSNDDLPIIGSKTKRKDTIKDNHIEARVRKRNERGETALHVAAIRGDLEDVVALIKAGALVNAKDNAGWTPLHEACNYGYLRIVQELVWSGADVNSPGYEAITPLHDAVINDHVKVVKFLLDNGADPKLQTSQNYSTSELARSAAVLSLVNPEETTRDSYTSHSHEVLLQPPQYEVPNFYLPGAHINGIDSSFNQRSLYNGGLEDIGHVHVNVGPKNHVSQVNSCESSNDVEMCVNPQEDFGVSSGNHFNKQDFHEHSVQGIYDFSGSTDHFASKAEETESEETEDLIGKSPSTKGQEENDKVSHRKRVGHFQQLQCYNIGSTELNGITEFESKRYLAERSSENLVQNLSRESMSDKVFPNNSEESTATETLVQINARNLPTKKPDLSVTSESEEDTVIPEKLNECLDKALIEISSYLETSQNLNVKTPHDERDLNNGGTHLSKNNKSAAGDRCSNEFVNVDPPPITAPMPLENTMIADDHCQEGDQLAANTQIRETEHQTNENNTLSDDFVNSGTGSFECQPVVTFTKIKPRNERKKDSGGGERGTRSGRRKRSSTRSSESSKYEINQSSMKEECTNHIPNATWRSDLPEYRYSLSAMPFSVPGYEDFLINSRNGSKSLSKEMDQEPANELDRLITQHDTEKIKLRMSLEQELVRLFGTFACKAAGYQIPYSACTVITSQMRPLEMKKVNEEKEQPVSIKLEVDKILSKFNSLKTEMLRRQSHEFEAIIALGNFWSQQQELTWNGALSTRSWKKTESQTYSEDFELLPAKFNEYYEEFLCATD